MAQDCFEKALRSSSRIKERNIATRDGNINAVTISPSSETPQPITEASPVEISNIIKNNLQDGLNYWSS